MKWLCVVFLFLFSVSLSAQIVEQEFENQEIVTTKRKKIELQKNEYILDFLFIQDKTLLLSKLQNKYQLKLLNKTDNVLAALVFDRKPIELYTDCIEYTHIVFPDSAYQIFLNKNQIDLLFPISTPKFRSIFDQCVGYTDRGLIFETYYNKNQTHLFFEADTVNNVNNIIYMSHDAEEYYSLVENEWMNRELASSSPDFLTRMRAAQSVWFNLTQASAPAYIPMFKLDSALIIFDHKKGVVEHLDTNFSKERTFTINYHNKESWHPKVLLDQEETIFYNSQIPGGLLSLEVLNKNYQSEKAILLADHTFPQKLKVKDGFAYYIAKETKESDFVRFWKVRL